jgi:hypothetical protein
MSLRRSNSVVSTGGVSDFSFLVRSETVEAVRSERRSGSCRTICCTRPRRTETMMAASSVSRNTMKKIGTEKRLFMMGGEKTVRRRPSEYLSDNVKRIHLSDNNTSELFGLSDNRNYYSNHLVVFVLYVYQIKKPANFFGGHRPPKMAIISQVSVLLVVVLPVLAGVQEIWWNLTYVEQANPDGLYPRRVIGVNGTWP